MRKFVILSLLLILIIPMCVQEGGESPEIAEMLKEEQVLEELEKLSTVEKETFQEVPENLSIELPSQESSFELPTVKPRERGPWAILVETKNNATGDFLRSQGFNVYTYEEWVLLTDVKPYKVGVILRTEDPIYLMYAARFCKCIDKLLVVAPCDCEINKLEFITKRHLLETDILVGEKMCLSPGEDSELKAMLERFVNVISIETTADVARKIYDEGCGGAPKKDKKRRVPPGNIG